MRTESSKSKNSRLTQTCSHILTNSTILIPLKNWWLRMIWRKLKQECFWKDLSNYQEESMLLESKERRWFSLISSLITSSCKSSPWLRISLHKRSLRRLMRSSKEETSLVLRVNLVNQRLEKSLLWPQRSSFYPLVFMYYQQPKITKRKSLLVKRLDTETDTWIWCVIKEPERFSSKDQKSFLWSDLS